MDLSRHTSLAGIAEAIGAVQDSAASIGRHIFVTGALARDLWIAFGAGLDTRRRTNDVDFAVSCTGWEEYETLSRRLVERRLEPAGPPHRFRHPNETEIDVMPYGGLERDDRTLAWPPDGNPVMNLLGVAELAEETSTVLLPGGVRVPVVTLPALALLKLFAWEDRRTQGDQRDASDIHVIAEHYLEARIPALTDEEKEELLGSNGLDSLLAGATQLGRDMAQLGSAEVRDAAAALLHRESNPGGQLYLAQAFERSRYGLDLESSISVVRALGTAFLE